MKEKNRLNNYENFMKVLKLIYEKGTVERPVSLKEIQKTVGIDKRSIENIVTSFCNAQDDFDITITRGKYNQIFYHFSSTPLMSFGEAKAIVDMVYSSKFFNEHTKEMFKERMKENFKKDVGVKLDKIIYTHLTGNENDASFYNVFEELSIAIYDNKKVSFIYSKPLPSGQSSNNTYIDVWPIDTYCWNNTFYLYCYIPKEQYIRTFRIDFIKELHIGDNYEPKEEIKERTRDLILDSTNAYGPVRYAEELTINFKDDCYSNIIDKFGKNTIKTKYVDNDIYSITIKDCPISPQFYAWIIGFNGLINIIGPENEIIEFKNYLCNFN